MIQKIICYFFGHKYFKVYELDNEYFVSIDFRCARCGCLNQEQFDK